MSSKSPSTGNQAPSRSNRRIYSILDEENILNEIGNTTRRPGKKSRLSFHQPNDKNPQQKSMQSSLGKNALVSPDPAISFNPKNLTQDSTRSTPKDCCGTKNQHIITPQEHDASIALASMSVKAKDSTRNIPSAMKHKRDHYGVPFPQTIYKMVTATVKSDPDVIEWVCDGEAFKIHQRHKNIGTILKKYFRHGKYSSVQRQLNMYGWSKHLTGKYKAAFYNPDFHRDSTLEQLAKIKRRGPPSSNKKASKAVVVRRSPRRGSMVPLVLVPVAWSSKQTNLSDKKWELKTQSRLKTSSTNAKARSSKARKNLGFATHENVITKNDNLFGPNIAALAKKQLENIAVVNLKSNNSSFLSPCGRSENCEIRPKCAPSNPSMELYEKRTPPPPNLTPLPESAACMSMEQAFGSPIDWSPFFPSLFQEPVPIGNTGVAFNGNSTPLQHPFSSNSKLGSGEQILIETRDDFTTGYRAKTETMDVAVPSNRSKASDTPNSSNIISDQFMNEIDTDYGMDSERFNATIPFYHPLHIKQNSSEPLMSESADEEASPKWNVFEIAHASIPSYSPNMMSTRQDSNGTTRLPNTDHVSKSGIALEKSTIGLKETSNFIAYSKGSTDVQDQSRYGNNAQAQGKRNPAPLFGSKRTQIPLLTTCESLNIHQSLSAKSPVICKSIPSPFQFPVSNCDSYPKKMLQDPPALSLSREGSGSYAPIPLTRRVSGSFYLPFVGLTETLSAVLSCPSPEEPKS